MKNKKTKEEITVDIEEGDTPVTEECIEYWLEHIEKGDFSIFEPASDCIYECHPPFRGERTTISFVAPTSINNALLRLAKERNCSKSKLLREFVVDGILNVTTEDA